jgi:YjbE family integral membrane protein
MDLSSAAFWTALGSIIWVNILLSGDNAVVIALAARSLPPQHQKKAIFWGSAAAIVLRIALTVIALEMLKWPYLKIVGGLLLLYIGTTLLIDDDDGGEQGAGAGKANVFAAIRTILIADLVMSLDNVIAVAAAAKGDIPLLVIGLAISIPLIIFGSTLLLKVMERFPIIVTAGAALLGYLAGEMLLTDPAVTSRWGELSHLVVAIAGAIGAAFVVILGTTLQRRQARAEAAVEP